MFLPFVQENIKGLVKYIVEHFSDAFKEVDYVETFKLLQLKYDQNKDFDDNIINKMFSASHRYQLGNSNKCPSLF